MANWYYEKGNDRFGPMNAREIKRIADSGQLLPSDLVWREGLQGWVEARRVKGLFPDQHPGSENVSPPPLPLQPPPLPFQTVDKPSTTDSTAPGHIPATAPPCRRPWRLFGQGIRLQSPNGGAFAIALRTSLLGQTPATTPQDRRPWRLFGQEIRFRRPHGVAAIALFMICSSFFVFSFLIGRGSISTKSGESAEGQSSVVSGGR